MKVLITNDDGPLNDQFSPYIRPFVQHLKRIHPDWDITICVPHVQRSWTGKAHLAGKNITLSYIYSGIDSNDNTFIGPFVQSQQLSSDSKLPYEINPDVPSDAIEWILTDGTPASCVNVALYHLKNYKFDLVVSGPNVGRNTSAAYITSSATVGAALESVITGNTRAIALSWAYFDGWKDVPLRLMEMASFRSTQIIEYLFKNWDPQVDLYSINVPLVESLSRSTKIFYTPIWENRWTSIFSGPHMVLPPTDNAPVAEIEDGNKHGMISFAWDPQFQKHSNSVHHDSVTVPTDMEVIEGHNISITPLRAVFQTIPHLFGELKLNPEDTSSRRPSRSETLDISKVVDYEGYVALTINPEEYIYEPLSTAIRKHLPWFKIIQKVVNLPTGTPEAVLLQYGDYEQLDMDRLLRDNRRYFANSYIYRKALIRKHYLAHTITHYIAKHPESILSKAFLESYTIDLDYAEFLDDALDENWELRQELECGDRWWIVKPSMSDKGQGIRVFRTIDDLQNIFNSFDDEAEEEGDGEKNEHDTEFINDTKVVISQLRHFIVQRYLENPLLLPSMGGRKFHIRCYITCKGDLEVFVYNRMLALFAPTKFEALDSEKYDPINLNQLQSHLTNTCLQKTDEIKGLSVTEFGKLQDISSDKRDKIIKQIHEITHDLFLAAATVNRINFQPLPNAFETYGVDFLVDSEYNVKILEVNAYPDFKQTGSDLKDLIDQLFDHLGEYVMRPLVLGQPEADERTCEDFTRVLKHEFGKL